MLLSQVHSSDHPSVNIDGIDRPSAEFQAEIRQHQSSMFERDSGDYVPGHYQGRTSALEISQTTSTRLTDIEDIYSELH